ncbi:MAG: hypothetical protein WBA57_15710 [Elainellaceae cyanobacterium]
MLTQLVRSLVLTGIAGFIAPMVFVGALVSAVFLIGYIPGLDGISHDNLNRVAHFLNVFGSGNPFRGVVVLGIVGGSVGMLFDTYALLATSKPSRY